MRSSLSPVSNSLMPTKVKSSGVTQEHVHNPALQKEITVCRMCLLPSVRCYRFIR